MKKSEKLFLAINEIDERLIKKAKSEEQKPIEMKPEPRSPIKGIIALAACIAVLAVGVFALVKLKLGGNGIEPSPIRNGSDSSVSDSASSELSSDTDSYDDNSDDSSEIDPTLTKEDLELQVILKDLTAKAADIDSIFTQLTDQGEKYQLKLSDTVYGAIYYPVTENRKTEPGGLFTVPQSRSGLEQLLLTCFTRRAVKDYMYDVGTGQVTVDANGKNVIIADQYGGGSIIEADGKLYCQWWNPENWGTVGFIEFDVDYTTAQVISKTDKTIRFTYYDNNGAPGKTEGVIMLEGGSWKLDFFHRQEFIPELPTEFTEEELELQDILNELSDAQNIFYWFYSGASYDGVESFEFRLGAPGNSIEYYSLMPKDEKASYCDLEYPQSCEELEELLLNYFTQNTVDKYMSRVIKGTMTENSDGTYTIVADQTYDFYRNAPTFIEIDGNMYLHSIPIGDPGSPIWNTAQITEKTPDSIKFTIIQHQMGEYYPVDGLIRYERDGWRLNYGVRGGIDITRE